MSVETDLYDLLGVSPTADEEEIKKAYRKKAKEHHPFQNPNDPEAGEKFQDMAAAYEILNDSNTREVYDKYGMAGLSGPGGGGGPAGGMNAEDLFAQFFAGAGGGGGGGGGGNPFGFSFGPGAGGPHQRRKGQDEVVPYDVTLEDLYNGKTVRINMEKDITCGVCKGTGARGSAKPKQCSTCEGKGWNFIHTHVGPGRMGTARAACSDCEGVGEKLRDKERCKKCKGSKKVKEKNRQEIFIEKGMADKQRIVLTGAGDQELGVPVGDVIFVLKAAAHESFERSGNDLLTKVTITLSEALLGFSRILVTHLDGRGVKVTSPPGKIIKPDDSIVLRGEGMPVYKNSDTKGNMYVVMSVEMPDENWLKSVNQSTLQSLLPPKKTDVSPAPAVVDEAEFEESDILDFGEGDEDWEDEEEDDPYEEDGAEPECRQQ
ncbi:DnaJ-domain-containing protein [Athelia psychrophila]|uniref:DnaJ-domain-containing protein n=1 Tax=Athelia psychrophila TaxID=1759441 RepID=A0A166UN56_9AGAM|nr:DnaJ-domain-containing protein [Fibularhizoctonia sp. CBS 109695]